MWGSRKLKKSKERENDFVLFLISKAKRINKEHKLLDPSKNIFYVCCCCCGACARAIIQKNGDVYCYTQPAQHHIYIYTHKCESIEFVCALVRVSIYIFIIYSRTHSVCACVYASVYVRCLCV